MGTVSTVAAIDVAEEAPIDFVYTDEIAPLNVTVLTATIEVDVRSGDDPLPQSLLRGPCAIDPEGTVVQQWVRGRLPSVGYAVRSVAHCSDGVPRTAVAHIAVKRL